MDLKASLPSISVDEIYRYDWGRPITSKKEMPDQQAKRYGPRRERDVKRITFIMADRKALERREEWQEQQQQGRPPKIPRGNDEQDQGYFRRENSGYPRDAPAYVPTGGARAGWTSSMPQRGGRPGGCTLLSRAEAEKAASASSNNAATPSPLLTPDVSPGFKHCCANQVNDASLQMQ